MTKLSKLVTLFSTAMLMSCATQSMTVGTEAPDPISTYKMIVQQDSSWIMVTAESVMGKAPRHVTEAFCERSQGGAHDFYSEGDYWWPDTENPEGPYIRRDGMSNPDNFVDHRLAMRDMSLTVAALTAAFKISGDPKYAEEAINHLNTWFINPDTRMNPNMAYAQAIKGRVPGRGVGLIDGIHLVEPARCIMVLHDRGQLDLAVFEQYKLWFKEFLTFMTTHEYGIDERDRKNNHGTCWVLQAATYATLTGDLEILEYCRDRYKHTLLPNQMSPDGGFHMELSRTKPYGYSLFNIDVMAAAVQILSTEQDNLWTFALEGGEGMKRGMEFIVPFIADKSAWPYDQDVMYWDQWPQRHVALLFYGTAMNNSEYLGLWKQFPPMPETQEGLRNFPIRMPVLWYD